MTTTRKTPLRVPKEDTEEIFVAKRLAKAHGIGGAWALYVETVKTVMKAQADFEALVKKK